MAPAHAYLVHSPGSGVGVRVPGLLLYLQGGLGQQCPEPAWDVGAHVVHFVCVLPTAPRPISVGPVGQDLHTTALTTGLLPALLLQPRTEQNWKLSLGPAPGWGPQLSSGPLQSLTLCNLTLGPPQLPGIMITSTAQSPTGFCNPALKTAIHCLGYIDWGLLMNRTKTPACVELVL